MLHAELSKTFESAPSLPHELAAAIRNNVVAASMIELKRGDNVYMAGEGGQHVYFVHSGQIKLHVAAPDGRCCTLAVLGENDVFGECCLSTPMRAESATAMQHSTATRIPVRALIAGTNGTDHLLQPLLRHLAQRVYEQQAVIANLLIDQSEQRLAKVLLGIARAHGLTTATGTKLSLRLSHQDLAEMVGTTRPRVSEFMDRFRRAGYTHLDSEHHLFVRVQALEAYVRDIGAGKEHRHVAPSWSDRPAELW